MESLKQVSLNGGARRSRSKTVGRKSSKKGSKKSSKRSSKRMSGGARRRRGSKKSSKRMSGGNQSATNEANAVRLTMQSAGLGAQLTKGNLIAHWTRLYGKDRANNRFAEHAEHLFKTNKFKRGAVIPDTYIISDIDYYTVENS